MRTTLDIDDDVLFAAKEIARREKKNHRPSVERTGPPGFANAGLSYASHRTSAEDRRPISEIRLNPLASPWRHHHP